MKAISPCIVLITALIADVKAIISHHPTVVTLSRASSGSGASLESQAIWMNSVFIHKNLFICRLQQNTDSEILRADQIDKQSKLLPLTGTCFRNTDLDGFGICPNLRVEFGDRRFLVSQATPVGTYQAFAERGSSEPKFELHCSHTDYARANGINKLCRAGSLVGGEVVTNVYSNGSLALKSVLSSSKSTIRSSDQVAECQGLGIWNATAGKLMEIESLVTREGVTEIHSKSPLCFGNKSVSAEDLLLPLSNLCLTAGFYHRQFEVCFTRPRFEFRFVQLGHRLNHDWPSAVPFLGPDISPWNFDPSTRTLVKTIKTDQSCRTIEPAMTEQFRVTVLSINQFSIRGVSGTFSPMLFAQDIEGILVSDPSYPTGCSDSSFEAFSLTQSSNSKPWIALVRRGGCMFQDKALVAQRRGAVGIVIVNQAKRAMIPAMAAVPDKPMSDIPAVLVDRDGIVLDKFIGSVVRISPAPFPGQSTPAPDEKIDVVLNVGCQSIEKEYSLQCEEGDEVLMQLDGELLKHPVRIVEKINPELYVVSDDHEPREIVPGWSLFKDGDLPCTGQLGSFITDVRRTDSCEITVDIHSALLCGDSKYRPPLLRRNDVQCSLAPQDV